MTIREIFDNYVMGESIVISKNTAVSLEVFTEIFGGVDQPNYQMFLDANGYVDEENTGKGYKSFFDKCKSKGILN